MQSVISEINLLLSSHALLIIFPFSNDFFILFGNFSVSLIISSLQYILLYWLSISNKSWSSLSFKIFLAFVNIFWISNFISSLLSVIVSNITFNSLIKFSKLFDKYSKNLIFSFNLFIFSSLIISSIK